MVIISVFIASVVKPLVCNNVRLSAINVHFLNLSLGSVFIPFFARVLAPRWFVIDFGFPISFFPCFFAAPALLFSTTSLQES